MGSLPARDALQGALPRGQVARRFAERRLRAERLVAGLRRRSESGAPQTTPGPT